MLQLDILTPSYRYRHFIADAINSIREQGDACVRHIVQDAASPDGTADLIRTEFNHVDLVSEPDGGQSDALNRALARASGDVVGWLNADEFYLQGTLEIVRHTFEAHPDMDVLYGNAVFVDEAGQGMRALPAHAWNLNVLQDYGCFLPSCATFIRTEVLRDVGWDPTFRRAMDWDLWLSLASRGAIFRYLNEDLAAFRVHGAQVTATPESADRDEFDRLRAKHNLSPLTRRRRLRSRLVHITLKTISGGYFRQLSFRLSKRQKHFQWWIE